MNAHTHLSSIHKPYICGSFVVFLSSRFPSHSSHLISAESPTFHQLIDLLNEFIATPTARQNGNANRIPVNPTPMHSQQLVDACSVEPITKCYAFQYDPQTAVRVA